LDGKQFLTFFDRPLNQQIFQYLLRIYSSRFLD